MPIEGFAERPVDGLIRGWAWDSDNPERPVVVEAFDGEAFYARATADLFADQHQAAGRRAGRCLFELRVPPTVGNDVWILIEGTGDRLRTPPSSDLDPVRDWLDGPGARMRPNLLVHRLFQDLASRPATGAELARFAPQTGTPYGLVRLVRDILDEPTGTSLLTNHEVIRHAYVGVLGRVADEGGMISCIRLLHDGTPVSQLIRNLVDSQEFAAQYERTRTPDGHKELQQLSRVLHAAVTTLTLHATALAAPTSPATPDLAPDPATDPVLASAPPSDVSIPPAA